MRNLAIVCSLCIFLMACISSESSDQPQGTIEYEVTYLSNLSSMPTNLLPKKILLKFKSNKSITTIEGFMGMFSLSNICDFRKHTNTLILKVMDNKFVYIGEKYESPFFYDQLGALNITLTNETKIMAGLLCQKALATPQSGKIKPFEIYYTQEISLTNANKSSPFESIDGVLMQFNIKLSTIEMKLAASKYKKEYFSSDLFDIPKECKKISKTKMSNIINKLLE